MSRKNHSESETDFMNRMIDEYTRTHGDEGLFKMRSVASWMVRRKDWTIPQSQVIKDLAHRLSKAAKKKHHTDPQGRKVRTLHAAKYPRVDKHGQPFFETMWDYMQTMSAEHALVSFTQRHGQLEGGCRSLKTDVDSFNENSPRAVGNEIQLSFNFEFMLDSVPDQVVETIAPSEALTPKTPTPTAD
jgi:hypothetical protein